jgi:poly(3-hydroxybutyrate) depolymerase
MLNLKSNLKKSVESLASAWRQVNELQHLDKDKEKVRKYKQNMQEDQTYESWT